MKAMNIDNTPKRMEDSSGEVYIFMWRKKTSGLLISDVVT